jgi:hypothetical protein
VDFILCDRDVRNGENSNVSSVSPALGEHFLNVRMIYAGLS